jgi:menaquinol-cytochrome c reductase iron-sulfur subunit
MLPAPPGERPDATPDSPARRAVLNGLTVAVGALIGAAVAVPVAGMLLTPLRQRGRTAPVAVGPMERFRGDDPIPTTVRFSRQQAWQRRESAQNLFVLPASEGVPTILSARCTHLGCQVRWEGSEFLCPCHGGRFDREGRCLGGPPTRPLVRLESRVQDGVLYVMLPVET